MNIEKLEKWQDKIFGLFLICIAIACLCLVIFITSWLYKQLGVDNVINISHWMVVDAAILAFFSIIIHEWFDKKIKKEKSQEPRPSDSEWIATDDGE